MSVRPPSVLSFHVGPGKRRRKEWTAHREEVCPCLLVIIHRIPSVDTAQWEQYTLLHGRCDASVVAHQAVVRRSGVRIRYLPSLRLTVVSRRVATWDDIWRWICPLAGDEEEKLGKIAKKNDNKIIFFLRLACHVLNGAPTGLSSLNLRTTKWQRAEQIHRGLSTAMYINICITIRKPYLTPPQMIFCPLPQYKYHYLRHIHLSAFLSPLLIKFYPFKGIVQRILSGVDNILK